VLSIHCRLIDFVQYSLKFFCRFVKPSEFFVADANVEARR
jgi:hypothetical protein